MNKTMTAPKIKGEINGVIAETSELVVPGLPYVVVYVIEPEFVDIVAVYHTAQNR